MKQELQIFLVLIAFFAISISLPAQVIVTKQDSLVNDVNNNMIANPGDSLRYKTKVKNVGGVDATDLEFDVNPDGNIILDGASVRTTPVAVNDNYAVTGNVGISVPAGSGLKVNDFDDNLALATITPQAAQPTTMGGTVTVNADGSFTYNPPPGFTGTDNFTYTLEDGNALPECPSTNEATVVLNISEMIVFIDNSSVAAENDGRLTSPFKSLVDFNAGSPNAAPVIYIESTGSNYTGGIVLQNNERLFGEGHTGGASLANVLPFALAPHSLALPAISGSRPVITNAAGDGVTLAMNNILRGFNVGNCSAVGIDDNGSVATLQIAEVSINNTIGAGINLDNGGSVQYTGSGNTIVTGSSTAVRIVNTAIGAAGVTLQSISMNGGNGASSSIVLTNTGNGTFTVTGVGSTGGSGGTIQNILTDAVTFINTDGRVTFRNMIIQDIGSTAGPFHTRSGHDAIHGEQVDGGLTLENVTIRRVSDNAINGVLFTPMGSLIGTVFNGLIIQNCLIEDSNRFHVPGVGDDSDEGMIRIIGLTGVVQILNSTLQRGGELLDIQSHTSGTLSMTIQGNNFINAFKEFNSGTIGNVGKAGIDINILGSTNANIVVGDPMELNGSLGNAFVDCATASIRILTTLDNTTTIMPTGVSQVIISRNTFRVTDHSSSLGLSGNFPQGGVAVATNSGPGTINSIISHNTFGTWDGSNTSDECMNADGGTGNLFLLFDTGSGNARLSNNTFNGPINSAWGLSSEFGATGTVLLENNVYRRDSTFFSPDPGFGTFNVPGLPSEARVRNNGILNLTIRNEDHAPHELRACCCCCGGCNEQTLRFTTQSSGGTLNLHCTNVDSPNGFDLTHQGGTFNLFRGVSGSSVPTTIFSNNSCTGGGTNFNGNPGQNPPTVQVTGVISIQPGVPPLP